MPRFPIVLTLLTVACRSLTPSAEPAAARTTLVITNKTPATATIVDEASGAVLATLPTGQGPHEVVASRRTGLAVVTDYGAQVPGKTLTVIDVGRRAVIRTIDLGEYRRPHGIVFLPGDTLVAVTSETHRAVLIVDVQRGQVLRAVTTQQAGSHMVGVVASGTRGYTGDIGSNTVTELDLVSGAVLRRFDVPSQPEAINVTPRGEEVWVGSNATGKVSAIDLSSGTVKTAAEGFGWPYRVLFTPDARLVLLPDYRGEALRFVDRVSKQELGRMPFPGGGPQGIALSSDARTAYLSLSAQGKVAVIDVATRTVRRTIAAGGTPDGVAVM